MKFINIWRLGFYIEHQCSLLPLFHYRNTKKPKHSKHNFLSFIYLFSKHFIYLTTLTQSPQETNALKAIGLTFWEGLRQRCIQGHPRTMCLYWTAVGTRASSVGLLCSVMGISLSSVWSCCSSAWEQGTFPEHLAFQHKATEAVECNLPQVQVTIWSWNLNSIVSFLFMITPVLKSDKLLHAFHLLSNKFSRANRHT